MGTFLNLDDEPLHTDEIEVTGFVNVSVGDHVMQIEELEDGATKNGNGRILKVRWQVTEDSSQHGRCVFEYINYLNPSADAQRIGREQLKQICEAVGYTGPLSGVDLKDVLCYRPCIVSVKMSKGDDHYDASPKVRKVK